MRGTKQMLGLLGWLRADVYKDTKNTNKPHDKKAVRKQRVSRRRNQRVK